MIKVKLFAIGLLLSGAGQPNGQTILEAIDRNTHASSVESEIEMIVHSPRGSRTIRAKSFAEGTKKSFTEFLAPARDKGTKMLKLEKDLWTYYPNRKRVIRIAGHALRQSMMGSDMSFEDVMEDRSLATSYDAQVAGEETVDERACYRLELAAKFPDIAYAKRTLWVDKERMVALKEKLYAKSGKELKQVDVLDVQQVAGRWYPMKILYKDLLRDGKGTEITTLSIKFDPQIPARIFSKAALN